MADTQTPSPITKEDLLKKLKLQYKDSIAFADPRWRQRTRNIQLYLGVKPARKYKSEANFHVPYVATLLDNVWPLLTNKLPFADIKPRSAVRDTDAARLMDDLVHYTFEENIFEHLFMMCQKESMLADMAWVHVCWDYSNNRDCPKIEHLNTMDVRVHKNKIYLDDRWPIFITKEMTKDQMREQRWDEAAITKLGKSKLQTPQYRKSQRAAMGLTTEEDVNKDIKPEDELYEVVLTYCKMKLQQSDPFERPAYIVFANDEAILNMPKDSSDFASPYEKYDKEKYPLAILPYNPIPHVFYPESFIDPIYDQQVELNALENMKADNYKRRNRPPLKVRRSGNVDLDSLQFVSGVPWLMDEMDDVMPFEIPDLALSIDNQQRMIKQQMQARTGANDILLVTDEKSLIGGDTATGASIANENTKMRFRPQANLIDQFVERIGQLVINRWQDENFFDRDRVFSIAGDDGQALEITIGPKAIQGDLAYKVQSNTSLAESDSARLQKFIQLKTLYVNDQNPNLQGELDKQIFQAAGLDYNKIKPNMDQHLEELSMTLEKLIATASGAQFKTLPQDQQNEIIAQIQQIKQSLEQAGGMAGGNPQGGLPQPAGAVSSTPASVVSPTAAPAPAAPALASSGGINTPAIPQPIR